MFRRVGELVYKVRYSVDNIGKYVCVVSIQSGKHRLAECESNNVESHPHSTPDVAGRP